MSKFYKCTYNKDNDVIFKVGKVYELTDKNRITGDDGYTWGPHHEGTIKWLEGKGWYKFEEVAGMEFITRGKLNTNALATGDWVEVVNQYGMSMTYQVIKDTPWGVVFRECPQSDSSAVDVEHYALDSVLPVDKYTSVRVYRGDRFTVLCNLHEKPCKCVFEWHSEPKRKR